MSDQIQLVLSDLERQILLELDCAGGARSILESAPPGRRIFKLDAVDVMWMSQDLCHAIIEMQVPDRLFEAADELCDKLEDIVDS